MWIRDLKVRIHIRPLINLWGLNDGFIRFWRSLTKKYSVKSAIGIWNITFFSTLTPVIGSFFHGSGSWLFRFRTGFLADPDPDSEKKSDPDPDSGKTPDTKHCHSPTLFTHTTPLNHTTPLHHTSNNNYTPLTQLIFSGLKSNRLVLKINEQKLSINGSCLWK